MKIRTKATLSGILAVVVSIIVLTTAVLFLIRAELVRQAHTYQDTKMRMLHELLEQRGEAKVADGKLQFGSYVVNGNYEVVDKLVAIAGGTATVFLGDTRISTNVMKDDGTRATGTPLVGVAKDVVLNRGQSYRGEADILGVPYFTAYDPLLDKTGRTFGVLYVGVKQAEFFKSFGQLVTVAVVIAVLLSLLVGFVVAYSTGRMLGRIAVLAKVADSISVGDALDVPVVSSSKDEIGELSQSIDRLRESMHEAMARLDSLS
jgi:methyl-accepting chemotaxis protein